MPQRDPEAARLEIVATNRLLEERMLRVIDNLSAPPSDAARPTFDGRSLAVARTQMQDAFMWLNRAVINAPRAMLPEDEINA